MKYEEVRDIWQAALQSADPYAAMFRSLRIEGGSILVAGASYEVHSFRRIVVAGAGKAAARMALAAEDLLGDRISEGLVIVKHGHTVPLRTIRQVEAAHPVPSEEGVEGTRRILELVRNADAQTLVIFLLSGGASALFVAPVNGVSLKEKQEVTALLLRAGASIGELNAVRKHLSSVKGGRFAKAACPAQVVTLILSDVIGDPLDVIASGPTAQDTTTYADALRVIAKYGLQGAVPPRVLSYLERGANGREPETVKSGDICLHKTRNVLIGGNLLALSSAREKARQLGYVPDVITAELQGEAREAARILMQTTVRVRDGIKPGERRCLLFGGETTVTVRGNGKGGRNQELALAFALAVDGVDGVTLLSAGTDGTDGPTDAAGAIVDGSTARVARTLGLHPETYLGNNDSYEFFSRFDRLTGERNHVITGPTGTNVMDVQVVLIDGPSVKETHPGT